MIFTDIVRLKTLLQINLCWTTGAYAFVGIFLVPALFSLWKVKAVRLQAARAAAAPPSAVAYSRPPPTLAPAARINPSATLSSRSRSQQSRTELPPRRLRPSQQSHPSAPRESRSFAWTVQKPRLALSCRWDSRSSTATGRPCFRSWHEASRRRRSGTTRRPKMFNGVADHRMMNPIGVYCTCCT